MLKNAPEHRLMQSQGVFHFSSINNILGLILSKSSFEMFNFMNQAF